MDAAVSKKRRKRRKAKPPWMPGEESN